jgi:hypothetical protein
MVLGPFNRTELFFGAGMGFHSNDARGATITESPNDPTTKLGASPLLVRTRGAETGIRTKIVPGLDSSVSLFILDQASELLFSGDAGDTSASRPSERYGVEWTNRYRPVSWVDIDADLAVTHVRFIGFDEAQAQAYAELARFPQFPQVLVGNAPGDFIPNAPGVVASAGITLGGLTGWFGTLRWRYLGPSPLTEDSAFRSPPTSIFNGRLGYRFDSGWRIQLDVLNLFNTRTNQINYAYGSLLTTDSLFKQCFPVQIAPAAVCQAGVMDYILHPAEPLSFRVSLTGCSERRRRAQVVAGAPAIEMAHRCCQRAAPLGRLSTITPWSTLGCQSSFASLSTRGAERSAPAVGSQGTATPLTAMNCFVSIVATGGDRLPSISDSPT